MLHKIFKNKSDYDSFGYGECNDDYEAACVACFISGLSPEWYTRLIQKWSVQQHGDMA